MENDWINKKVKVALKNGFYYKGLVLSEGETYIKIRDIKDNLVFINFDAVVSIEEVGGWKLFDAQNATQKERLMILMF